MKVLIAVGFLTRIGATSDFKSKAQDTIHLVEENLHIEDCIESARKKAYSVNKNYGDRYYAALWISMYSRECLINEDLLAQEKNLNSFPFRLNREVRCLRDNKRNSALKNIFLKVRDIIDESLDVFGLINYPTLYRGMTEWKYDSQLYFVEEGFFSTSTDATPALRFSKGNFLLMVQSMNGVSIKNFVQDKFTYQNEVLGKSGKMFQIERSVTDKNEINKTIENLNEKWDKLSGIGHPDRIIYVTEISGIDKQSVLDQQWKTTESYCKVQNDAMSFQAAAFSRYFFGVFFVFCTVKFHY